jgi:hypothetical protein
MLSRSLKFVLLACIVIWTSGAAQYAHERLEHAGHAEAMASGRCSDENCQNCPANHHKHSAPDDHDDCPTCQLLAHLTADRVMPPAAVCAHLPAFDTVAIPEARPTVLVILPSAPIRGPPAISLLCV